MKTLVFALAMLSATPASFSQDKRTAAPDPRSPSTPEGFHWVSPIPEARRAAMKLPDSVRHATFKSPSMGIEVGYYLYLPPGYDDKANAETRYPVVYHLHGGRPGGEFKSVGLSRFVDAAIRNGDIPPTIYVFPNGGPMSWYNYPRFENGRGEDVFVNETIPHIDATWRTLGREGRAIEGFSQGGRGTTRILLKHPERFVSAAPGGSGYGPEKVVRENNGAESETVVFEPGDNTWDLAAAFAKRPDRPKPPIRLWVGTKGFNYEFNLKYSAYLKELGIEHDMLIAEGVDHSAQRFYEKRGLELMQWHQANFAAAAARERAR
ncbi:MAG: 1,4-beta-xylanase [Verrucomicrobiae bacterium]|nr:1,4-beta-xylanase [Verrucomicrobiae bacterium]